MRCLSRLQNTLLRNSTLTVFALVVAVRPAHGGDAAEKKGDKAAQANVPVKVVVLFSSGVGYFEHGGSVQGQASTELRFKTQQINDILKSLVLQDLGGGKVGTVIYPSQDPVEKTLKSFGVDITGDPSLAELLGQLRGAKVAVASNNGESIAGNILGVEKRPKPAGDKGAVEVWVLNIVSGGTIRSVELAEAKKIELEDPQLQEELTKALLALSRARDQDKKPVTIRFEGQGERRVRIGYVVETPVWKTSYRLVLSGDKEAKPKLIGWAIVENQTDNDWADVQLSLVSGRPISFIQDLYRPLYVPRPTVQTELYASLAPQTYEGGLAPAEKQMQARAGEREMVRRLDEKRKDAAMKPQAPALAAGGAGRGEALGVTNGARRLALEDKMDVAASVESIASAGKVGELFQYTVGNVSLPRQQSAMIPIITDDLEVEKVSIYNQSVLPRNPLNGARLKNTTGKHLLAGPVTVLEGSSYAGDARVDNVPPGQQRLLSYGIDLQMLVDAKNNRQEAHVMAGKIVKGVLWVTHKQVTSLEYHAQNKSESARTLIVEHPLRGGWKLVAPEKFEEKTDSVYRFRLNVPAGETKSLKVAEEQVQAQEIAMIGADIGLLEMYARTGEIPQPVKDALSKAIVMKQMMAQTQRQIEEKRRQLGEITQEQTRIRENFKAVDRSSDYAGRLLKKLNDQETAIEKLQGEILGLQKTAVQQREELEKFLTDMTVE